MAQCIFQKLPNVFVKNSTIFGQFQKKLSKITKYIQTTKCICPNYQMYLSKMQHVFFQIAKCVCPNYIMYFLEEHEIGLESEPEKELGPWLWTLI